MNEELKRIVDGIVKESALYNYAGRTVIADEWTNEISDAILALIEEEKSVLKDEVKVLQGFIDDLIEEKRKQVEPLREVYEALKEDEGGANIMADEMWQSIKQVIEGEK